MGIYPIKKPVMGIFLVSLLLKVSMETQFLSQPQVEKCSRIYSNNIVAMGRYRDLLSILIEKGFLDRKHS